MPWKGRGEGVEKMLTPYIMRECKDKKERIIFNIMLFVGDQMKVTDVMKIFWNI